MAKQSSPPDTPTRPVPIQANTVPRCEPVGAFANGLLPTAIADNPLEVKVHAWTGLQTRMQIQLLWQDALYGPTHVVSAAEVADPDTVFTFYIDQSELINEGVFTLNYRVLSYPGQNEFFGDPAWNIRVDRTPPGGSQLAKLLFSTAVIDQGVTLDKLDSNERLLCTLPDYQGKQARDVVLPLLISATEEMAGTPVEVERDLPITVYFHRLELERIGDGEVAFTYTLQDRAGNTSGRAPEQRLQVLLNNVPAQLDAPQIPLYDTHGLINEAVARTPVQVLIPTYDFVAQNDEVIVTWGTQVLAAQRVIDAALDPLLSIPVPYAAVQAAGNGDRAVLYEVKRNGASLGISPATAVVVDISLPGGPDPDPGDPWHGNLLAPTALGRSNVPNLISFADLEFDAAIVVEWFARNSSEVFIENDALQIGWAGLRLPTYVISASDVTAKQPLSVLITSDQLKAIGPGDIDVQYSVTRPLVSHPGHSNTARSPVQVVVVESGSDLPGGGDKLPAGDFPEKNANNAINNTAAEDGTPFKITLDYINAAVGDFIEFEFHGHRGFGPSGDPIPEAFLRDTHTLTADDVLSGEYEFTVARANLAAVAYGSGVGHYWVSNAKGRVEALPYHVFIDVHP